MTVWKLHSVVEPWDKPRPLLRWQLRHFTSKIQGQSCTLLRHLLLKIWKQTSQMLAFLWQRIMIETLQTCQERQVCNAVSKKVWGDQEITFVKTVSRPSSTFKWLRTVGILLSKKKSSCYAWELTFVFISFGIAVINFMSIGNVVILN